MGIKTSGFADAADTLIKLSERVNSEGINKALKAGAHIVFKEMRRQATIDPQRRTGNLYKSIKTGKVMKTVRNTNYATEKYIKIGTKEEALGGYAPHAHLVEYGHGGPAPAPPHPFVRKAFDTKQEEALAAMKQALQETI